jgi:hypothetical protein
MCGNTNKEQRNDIVKYLSIFIFGVCQELEIEGVRRKKGVYALS